MPVSLPTPIASDLQISEGQAGQAISYQASFAVLTSFSSRGGRPRSTARCCVALTGMMIVSGNDGGIAPNYVRFMIGRALIGIAIGGFWSMSAATGCDWYRISRAQGFGDPEWRKCAGGDGVAAPLGSFLGTLIGWRGSFFFVVPIAASFFLAANEPPFTGGGTPAESRNVFKLLNRPVVTLGMAAVSLFFMGQFALFTYLRPFLEDGDAGRGFHAVADAPDDGCDRFHRHHPYRSVLEEKPL